MRSRCNGLYGWVMAAVLCAAPGAGVAAESTLRVAVTTAPAGSEFTTKHDDVTAAILHHVVEGLVAYDGGMSIAPLLAEGWTVGDGGRTYTFRLRRGIRFHNGAALDAATVKWNWDRFRDPAREWGSHCREWYDGSAEAYHQPVNLLSVEAPDAATVVFRLQAPSPLFLHLMASNHCITGIVHPSSVGPDGQWRGPVGTGPYLVESWSAAAVELRRFADYSPRPEPRSGLAGNRGGGPDRLTFTAYASIEAARAAFLAGNADLWFRAPFDQAREIDAGGSGRMAFQQTAAFHQLVMQTRFDPLLADVRMRRAIAAAIDIVAVTKAVTAGLGVANPSAVARGLPFHTAAHGARHAYDPVAARRLAEAAGYRGQRLSIQASRQPYPSFHEAARVIAGQLRAAGFDAHVDEVSWPDQDRNYAGNTFQMSSIAFSLRTDPSLMYAAIVGQKSDHSWYLWEEPYAAHLVARSALTGDPAERQALFDRLHGGMLDWVPTIGLFNHFVTDVVSPRVVNYETWILGLPRLWGVAIE